MLTGKLIDLFLKTDSAQKTISKLSLKNTNDIFISNISDAAKGFFLSSLVETNILNKTIVYCAINSTEAQNLYWETLNLTSGSVFYFQGNEVSSYDQIQSDVDVVSNQTKALLNLTQKKKPCLIITTLKFLSDKVWNKEDLVNNTFIISKSTSDAPDTLIKRLTKIGYKRTNVVTSKGEFSLRGDIFDIYPIVGPPARISYFGDEIESIKNYSITTQRSNEEIDSVLISPRFYVINEFKHKLYEAVKNHTPEHLLSSEIINQELSNLDSEEYPESTEYYGEFLGQRNSSLLDYLPENTLIMHSDWEGSILGLETWEKRNLEIKNDLETNNKIIPISKPLYIEKEYIISKLKEFSKCYFEIFEKFTENINSQLLNLNSQERFNNQIELLTSKISEWIKEGNKIIIFSDQPHRVQGLLKEWDIPSILTETMKEKDFEASHLIISTGGSTEGFSIPEAKIKILTDKEIFGIKRKVRLLHSKKDEGINKFQYFTSIEDLKLNDYVVHIKHGIGKYRGLVKISLDTNEREYLMVEYASEGKLYLPVEQINLLYRYKGSTEIVPKLSKLGGTDWELTKKKVKKAIKKVAEDLLNLYTARAKLDGFSFKPDSPWQIEMEEAFPYTETPDQWKAIVDVKKDMESNKPMDRLVCGDVGYGKTEVAMRAMFKAIVSGKQVAILVPTTILAQQHFNVISERFAAYPIRIGLLSRFKSHAEQKETIAKLALGEIDIVVGTHRLIQKDVKFKDLGLVVIDEEQRFGVVHKEKLKQLRVTVDVLTLSATPIPRTLYMAVSGARDLSIMNTPPTNRLPIKTFVGEFKSTIIKTAILHELERGGQVYFVHNRIESIDRTAAFIKEIVPEANIAIAHGQMNEKELESIMHDFMSRQYNVLVCTTIIESGLDIPNVNTIIIDNADQLGLAQMYQLRGRVGRTDIQAYAYCLYPETKLLTDVAKTRLEAIKEFTSLGSGYQIALRDMEIRGVGNILGSEQHGHMISIGFDLYCRLLNEAIDKLRGLDYEEIEHECEVDINISAYIPSTYIPDESQKIVEYKRLANIRSAKELDYIKYEWEDRFGKIPEEVNNLLKIVDLRLFANKLKIQIIKSENISGSRHIKISSDLRLQKWFSLQKSLPLHLLERTTLKSSAKSGTEINSFILFKTAGLNAEQLLDMLKDLLVFLSRTATVSEKIA